MNIWEVGWNNDFKRVILVNSHNERIADNIIYFKEKQEDTSFIRTIKTLDADMPLGDIMNYISMSGTFVLNEKTKIILEKHFNEIQFFNTICPEYPEEKFFLLNTFNFQNILDVNKCKYTTVKSKYGELKIGTIKSYAFKEEARNLDIFKIIVNGKKRINHLFVTDTFKDIMEQNNITGLRLKKVYEF